MTGAALLLDTHVWIWTVEGRTSRLSTDVLERIDAAAAAGKLHVHPISVWEVGTLVRKGRLTLAGPTDEWVADALDLPGVTLIPMTPEAALSAAELPDTFPDDPADRILAASAYRLGATLVTCDGRILEFEGSGAPRRLAGSG